MTVDGSRYNDSWANVMYAQGAMETLHFMHHR